MAKSKKIEEIENKIKLFQEKYAEAKQLGSGLVGLWLEKIVTEQKSLKKILDNVTAESTTENEEAQLDIVQASEEASSQDPNKLGTWKGEHANKNETTGDSISALQKIYAKVLQLGKNKYIDIDEIYGFGPLNKGLYTKIFDAIFPFMLQDMVNKNIDGYIPRLQYQVEEINGNKTPVLIIGDIGDVSITKYSGNFISIMEEGTEEELSVPVTSRIHLSGMKIHLKDLIPNINFTQLELNEEVKQQYVSAIKQAAMSYANDPQTITEKMILANDPEDKYLLNKLLSDAEKVAINLYTGDYIEKINWVMYRCDKINNTSLLKDLVNPALSTIAIASDAIDNFPINNIPTVVRGEYSNSRGGGRLNELITNVQKGIIIKNTSLFSTAIEDNGKPYGDIKLVIKDPHGIYVGPMSEYGEREKELLLSAGQQIAFEAYVKTADDKYHVFACKSVNNMVPVTDYYVDYGDWVNTLGNSYFDDNDDNI